ncbi:ABC transporter substrate-binding protein [Planctomonas psychrotolerans]|uniref:ABC transporter substrate-binding protein n=1 Tax=Planctomonas psychrotolerans TaxID=2528712 RepID=UPI0012386EBC|nr:ABC transporter substrate-binding protein [Planctomonas psychrotolerans]
MTVVRRGLGALCAAVLAVSLVGCTSAGESDHDAEDDHEHEHEHEQQAVPGSVEDLIRFGIALPQTGADAVYGSYFTQGFELALKHINESGGVDGRYIELQYEDTQADPALAVTVAQTLADDPTILASLGGYGAAAEAGSPVYQEEGLVQIIVGASSSAVTSPGDYIFATAVSPELEAPRLADLARTKGTRSAVFVPDTAAGADAHRFLADRSAEIGLDEVHESAYPPGATDFRPLLTSAAAENPDVIVLLSSAVDGGLLMAQARELGIDVPIVGASSTHADSFLEQAGTAAEGFEALTYLSRGSAGQPALDFLDAFEGRYGFTPSEYAARAYDALYIAAHVAGEENTRDGIRNALAEDADLPSVLYGPTEFSDDRRVTHPEPSVVVVRDAEFMAGE